MIQTIDRIDRQFSQSIINIHFRPLTLFFQVLTLTGTGTAWILGAVVSQFLPVSNEFRMALLSPLLTWLVGRWVKRTTRRPRPFQQLQNIPSNLTWTPVDDSFPSLHAGSTFSFWITLFWWHQPGLLGIAIWALLTSFSRIYLGVHFLSDVLAGALLGLICGSLLALSFSVGLH